MPTLSVWLLQDLLDNLNNFCMATCNDTSVNAKYSNIIHYRHNSIARTTFMFTCGGQSDFQIYNS